MDLKTPLSELGIGFKLKKAVLQRLEIQTVEDLLFYLPFRYEDYTNASTINKLQIGEQSVIRGVVIDIKNEYTKGHFVIQKAQVSDSTGEIDCTWFNQTYLTRVIKSGDQLGLVGKLEFFGRKRTFMVKDYEVLTHQKSIHTTGFVPIYSETRGITSKWLRDKIYELLFNNSLKIEDFLSKTELERLNFLDLLDTLKIVHFPNTLKSAEMARKRLSFDELFIAQLAALKRREEWNRKNKGIPFEVESLKLKVEGFIKGLPFKLTEGQNHALDDIKNDLRRETPMNRLLEGDVGSGKTIVAAIAIYISHLNGYQSVIMAPTEILANQHYDTLKKLFEPLDISVGLKTGSKKLSSPNSSFSVLVGTHSLIQKDIEFERLGLVVIDEQQRFGVKQRAILREKGKNPHFLTMTATPIPRTILLAIYKDLDVSYLQELPNGRQKVKTWLVPNEKKTKGYAWIRSEIEKSNFQSQAFVVCPFIEESESMNTVKAAKVEFERLKNTDLKGLKLELLHGKLKAKEKEKILKAFFDKKINVLISTPVVEVGIDIPDATIMVVEDADRFGLSQLHQLRGRVGRADKQSYCLLFTESASDKVIKRLKFMEQAHSGFELAELDLKLRGGGDLFGTRQHGLAGFKIADFSDFDLVNKAKVEAEKTLPSILKKPLLLEKVENVTQKLIHPD